MTSLITSDDIHYFNEGTHGSLASVLGSHPRTVAGVAGRRSPCGRRTPRRSR